MYNLIDRGLIVSTGRLDVPGRPMLYGTTPDFLRCFGLDSLDSLPKTSDELLDAFNNAKAAEAEANESQEESPEIAGAEQISVDITDAMPESVSDNESDENQDGVIGESANDYTAYDENADDVFVDDLYEENSEGEEE
jgi:hypothetical protein